MHLVLQLVVFWCVGCGWVGRLLGVGKMAWMRYKADDGTQ